MIAQAPTFMLLLIAFFALAACEFEREGTQALPMQFLAAKTEMVSNDMVDVSVSVARPRPGALKAYADCVGSQYARIRGMKYARRVTSSRTGFSDVLTDKVTFLISPVRPAGDFVLDADEIIVKCKRVGVPTF